MPWSGLADATGRSSGCPTASPASQAARAVVAHPHRKLSSAAAARRAGSPHHRRPPRTKQMPQHAKSGDAADREQITKYLENIPAQPMAISTPSQTQWYGTKSSADL